MVVWGWTLGDAKPGATGDRNSAIGLLRGGQKPSGSTAVSGMGAAKLYGTGGVRETACQTSRE